jgi:hypothetical protein
MRDLDIVHVMLILEVCRIHGVVKAFTQISKEGMGGQGQYSHSNPSVVMHEVLRVEPKQ